MVGVLWWLSGLKIQRCHCCGSGYLCGTGSFLGPGTSEYRKKKKRNYVRRWKCKLTLSWESFCNLCVSDQHVVQLKLMHVVRGYLSRAGEKQECDTYTCCTLMNLVMLRETN